MTDENKTIECPHCHQTISLDEALTHQMETKLKLEYDAKLQQEKRDMWKIAQEKALEKVEKEAKNRFELEIKNSREELTEEKKRNQQLITQVTELNRLLRNLKRKDDERELEKEKQITAERDKIVETERKRAEEEQRLKFLEKDKQLSDIKKQLEEAQRKANQGSQQTQGEVLEMELEEILGSEFPFDEIVPVAKGINGADVLQKVRDNAGRLAGIIAWESKRTKAWSDGWVQKLKDDQRSAKAEVAVLISHVLPKEMKYFGPKDGIYVCDYHSFVGLAKLLRLTIIQLAAAKLANVGRKEKMEVLWNYLTGVEFRQRMEAIIETFIAQKNDLEREKRAYTKIWARREKQIQKVLDNTIGLRGDLEGVMGNALPEMKQLELDNGQEELDEIVEEV